VSVSTHVLDAVAGRPAAGVPVELARREDAGWVTLASATTDADGRIASFTAGDLAAGAYRLTFEIEGHVAGETFYPQVVVVFRIRDLAGHYHVPVLLSPFSYSTYRGS
jgi:5-hydroxyisourate hydrolase